MPISNSTPLTHPGCCCRYTVHRSQLIIAEMEMPCAAFTNGLRSGHHITHVDGQPVETWADYTGQGPATAYSCNPMGDPYRSCELTT